MTIKVVKITRFDHFDELVVEDTDTGIQRVESLAEGKTGELRQAMDAALAAGLQPVERAPSEAEAAPPTSPLYPLIPQPPPDESQQPEAPQTEEGTT